MQGAWSTFLCLRQSSSSFFRLMIKELKMCPWDPPCLKWSSMVQSGQGERLVAGGALNTSVYKNSIVAQELTIYRKGQQSPSMKTNRTVSQFCSHHRSKFRNHSDCIPAKQADYQVRILSNIDKTTTQLCLFLAARQERYSWLWLVALDGGQIKSSCTLCCANIGRAC